MAKTTKLLKLPPYRPELYVKRTVAVSFWKDSNDLLWRATIFSRQIGHDTLSTKAKTYVDLIMAIECSLKSLIMSLSLKDETPESAYLVARRCSHNLDRLYQEVKIRAKNRVKLLDRSAEEIIQKANNLGVGYRYDITAFMFLSQEDWFDRSRRSGWISSVINHDFIGKLHVVAHELNKLSGDTVKKYLGKYARVNTKRWEETDARHSMFLTTLGTRF
ncbi:MAG: hypothetical protein P4L51_04025 [Puia sp.]|nr:hypothetical protein [Puia sp.]